MSGSNEQEAQTNREGMVEWYGESVARRYVDDNNGAEVLDGWMVNNDKKQSGWQRILDDKPRMD